MERITFNKVVRYLHGKMDEDSVGNPQLSIEKQLQITLWLFGNQEVYRYYNDNPCGIF